MTRGTGYGFALIEVMVSIFVLALGVLGAAGMQLTALRTTQQSGYQSIALQLAAEMADKMRANASQMKQNDNTNPFLAVNYQSALDGAPQAPSKLCYTVTCDGDELAKFDIYEWKQRIKTTLPGGRAVICRDSAPWDSSSNSLVWDCHSEGGGTSLVIKVGWQAKNSDGSLVQDGGKQSPPSIALTVEPYIK